MVKHQLVKPGVHGLWPRMPGFLNCFGLRVGMCVYVSAPRALVTSDVIWCDIDCVRLVKQVLWLFPAFGMGVAILNQHFVNTCQRKLR